MSTTVGKAKVTFEADTSQVSDALVSKMDEALKKIDSILSKIESSTAKSSQAAGDALCKGMEDGAKRADKAVDSVGKGGMPAIQEASRKAADTVAKSFEDGASKADAALGKVDGQALDRVAASASSAADTISSRVSAAADQAGAALDRVDGSAFSDAASSAAAAADTIGSRLPSASQKAKDSMREAGSEGSASLKDAEGSASLLIGTLGKVAVAAAALAGPATIVQKGWARLTSIDEARHKLVALGNSAADIELIMDNAMESVTGTSFGFGDAASQASMLVAAGIKPGQELERTLKLVADSASVAGVDLNEMGAIWGKVAASGKLSGEEMAQLLDRQIGLQSALADHFGVTAEEAKKMVSEGKVDFAAFADVMENMVGGGAEVMGGTVRASLENVGAAAGRLGEALLKPVFQAAPSFLGGVQKGLGWATNQLKDFQEWMGQGSLAAEALKVAIISIGAASTVGAIAGVVNQLGGMTRAIELARKGITMLNLSFLTSPWGLAIAGITALVATFVILWNRSEAFRDFWIGLWESIKNAVTPGVDWVVDKVNLVKDVWQELVGAVKVDGLGTSSALASLIGESRAQAVIDTLSTVSVAWEELVGAFQGRDWGYGALGSLIGMDRAQWVMDTITNVQTAWGELTTAFQGGDDGYGALAALIGEETAEWAVNALANVKTAWEELTTAFQGGDDGYGALAAIFGEQGAEWLVNTISMVGDALRLAGEWMAQLWDVAVNVGQALGGAIWETIVAIFTALVSVGQALFSAFQEIATAVWGLIQALAPVLLPILKAVGLLIGGIVLAAVMVLIGGLRLLAGVVEIAANVISWLASNVLAPLIGVIAKVASALISGLAAALSSVVEWVGKTISFVSDMQGKITGAFSAAGSWLYDAGRNIVQGLLNGIKSLAGSIGSAFLNVVPGWIREPFKKALGIASPSKVFMEYGTNIGEGIIQGVTGMESQVQDATSGLAAAAANVALPQSSPQGGPVTVPVDAMAPAMDALQVGMDQTAAAAVAATSGVITPAWMAMATGIQAGQASLVDPAMAGMRAGMDQTAALVAARTGGQIVPAWQNMGAQVMGVKVGTIDPAFQGIQGGLAAVVGAFANGANAVGQHMGRMRELTAAPVRFTISSIFNDGVVGMWNSVSDLLGTTKMAPYPVRFASGGTVASGILPGYTPGKDIYRFIDPLSGMAIDLSGGEAIMRPEVTRALGTHHVDGLNAAARMGGPKAVEKYLGSFASGGVVGSIVNLVRRFFPGMSITDTYRPGARDYHGAGLAVDFSDGFDTTPGMQAASRFFYQNYGKMLLELIHWPLRGWQNIKHGQPMNYGQPLNNQHRNHVHVASRVPLPDPGNVTSSFDGASWDLDLDWVGMFAGDAEKKLQAALKGGPKSGGLVDQWPPNIGEKLHKATRAKLDAEFDRVFSMTGSGNVDQWAPMVSALLRLYGHPASWLGNTLRRMNQESGGDPRAINLWDSNAMAGTPSKGLMQVIDPTFQTWRDARFPDNIWDPRANIAASMRYAMGTYGSLPAAYDRAGGYHLGGVMGQGQGWFHKSAFDPERVLSPQQTASFDRLVDWLAKTPQPEIKRHATGTGTAYGAGSSKQVHVTQNIYSTDPQRAADAVEDRLTRLLV